MSELNYLRMAQILGGKLTEIQTPSFGSFGAPQALAERLRLVPAEKSSVSISREQFGDVADAFEEVRDGYEPDRVLIDPALAKKFIAACRQRGIKAPAVEINKRLQSFRKAKSLSIVIPKATRPSGIDATKYFYAAETGYAQLSFRRKATVDDIVTDPAVGNEYVEVCKAIAPTGTSIQFKWAALSLRKMRTFGKKKRQKLLAVDPRKIEEQLRVIGSLDSFSSSDLPQNGGIFSFSEKRADERYLFIGASENIHESVEPFRDARPFFALAGRFWNPALSDIKVRIGEIPKRWNGESRRDLSFRLIEERHPLFNMPVEIGQNEVAV